MHGGLRVGEDDAAPTGLSLRGQKMDCSHDVKVLDVERFSPIADATASPFHLSLDISIMMVPYIWRPLRCAEVCRGQNAVSRLPGCQVRIRPGLLLVRLGSAGPLHNCNYPWHQTSAFGRCAFVEQPFHFLVRQSHRAVVTATSVGFRWMPTATFSVAI